MVNTYLRCIEDAYSELVAAKWRKLAIKPVAVLRDGRHFEFSLGLLAKLKDATSCILAYDSGYSRYLIGSWSH